MPAAAKKYTKDLTKSAVAKTFTVTLTLRTRPNGYGADTAKALGETIENSYLWGDYDLELQTLSVEDTTPKTAK